MNNVQSIKNQIRYMCMAFKNRSGGSVAECQCQEYIETELKADADTVVTQDFTVHPDAGWAWIIIVAVSGMASIILPLFNVQSTWLAILSFSLSLLAVLVTVFQFLMGYCMIDRLFPGKRAKNVFATVKPRGEVKQRIVFTGHADAAYEMTYSHRGGAKKVLRVAVTAIAGLVITFLLNTAVLLRHIIAGGLPIFGVWHWLRIAALLFLPAFIRALFFFNIRCIVDGANDNLSGCVVAMAALRQLSAPQMRLEHTEVGCLITSSEECGLRGARAFGQQYVQESDGIETLFVVLDTLHDVDQLRVYSRGMNGFQENSGRVANLLYNSAQTLGFSLPEAESYLGATDAEALSREGLHACALCGVDHNPQPYYHTRADNADNINEECLSVCLDICLEAARAYDKETILPGLQTAV